MTSDKESHVISKHWLVTCCGELKTSNVMKADNVKLYRAVEHTVIKSPTSPEMCCYTTLWKLKISQRLHIAAIFQFYDILLPFICKNNIHLFQFCQFIFSVKDCIQDGAEKSGTCNNLTHVCSTFSAPNTKQFQCIESKDSLVHNDNITYQTVSTYKCRTRLNKEYNIVYKWLETYN